MIELEPIPSGVYYDAEFDNFLSVIGGGMGTEFWETWKSRASEFPVWVPDDAVIRKLATAIAEDADAPGDPRRAHIGKTEGITHTLWDLMTPDTQAYFIWKDRTLPRVVLPTPEVKLGWDAGCAHVRKELELRYEGERDRLLAEVDRISGVLTNLHSTACKVRDALQLHQNTRLSATLAGELSTALAKVSP